MKPCAKLIGNDEKYKESLRILDSINGEAILRRMLVNSGIDIEETEFV